MAGTVADAQVLPNMLGSLYYYIHIQCHTRGESRGEPGAKTPAGGGRKGIIADKLKITEANSKAHGANLYPV